MKTYKLPYLQSHQYDCVCKVLNELHVFDRCKAIAACGTGKTRIGVEVAKGMKAKTAVVYVPSLALIRQTLPDWLNMPFDGGISYLCVCSDSSVNQLEDDPVLTVSELIADLGLPQSSVTTDAQTVKNFLNNPNGSHIKVIFSTYQSSDVVRDGLPEGFTFDFGLFDEAHKTTGAHGAFSAPLLDTHTPIKKRLFMTATPKHYNLNKRTKNGEARLAYSMDDVAAYGQTAYNLPIRKAIELGIIAGYQVLVSVVDDKAIGQRVKDTLHGQLEAVAHAIAIRNAMAEYGLSKAVTFHDSIGSAKFFAENADIQKELGIQTFHVNGTLKTSERSHIMQTFADCEKGVVTNARCLTEGVDVPAIDMVAFLHPKKSPIDIIQAIGRALRLPLNSSKTTGYILLPLYVSDTEHGGLESALIEYGYDTIFQVIQALREQDEVVESGLYEAAIEQGKKRHQPANLGFIKTTWNGAQIDMLREVISTRIIESLVESWYTNFSLLQEVWQETGNCNVEKKLHYRGVNIGFWCSTQRANYKAGILAIERIKRLEAMGFQWDTIEAAWEEKFMLLKTIWQETGSSNINTLLKIDDVAIGEWVLGQRKNHKKGMLPDYKIAKLESIGFEFDLMQSAWQKNFEPLKTIHSETGDIDVAHNYIKHGVKIGSWCSDQRKRYKQNRLSEERIALLETLGFKWDILEYQWDKNLALLGRVKQEQGNVDLRLTDIVDNVKIGQWLDSQKHFYRKGMLSQERIVKLEALGVSFERAHKPWDESFDEIKKYYDAGDFADNAKNSFYENSKVKNWLAVQRKSLQNDRLTKDRLLKLESIGVHFKKMPTKKRLGWDFHFEQLKAIKESKGELIILRRDTVDGVSIGQWAVTQRKLYKLNRLSADRVAKLQSIGFDFRVRETV